MPSSQPSDVPSLTPSSSPSSVPSASPTVACQVQCCPSSTYAPTTGAPTPTTDAPTTGAPTTDAPTTVAPTTVAPTEPPTLEPTISNEQAYKQIEQIIQLVLQYPDAASFLQDTAVTEVMGVSYGKALGLAELVRKLAADGLTSAEVWVEVWQLMNGVAVIVGADDTRRAELTITYTTTILDSSLADTAAASVSASNMSPASFVAAYNTVLAAAKAADPVAYASIATISEADVKSIVAPTVTTVAATSSDSGGGGDDDNTLLIIVIPIVGVAVLAIAAAVGYIIMKRKSPAASIGEMGADESFIGGKGAALGVAPVAEEVEPQVAEKVEPQVAEGVDAGVGIPTEILSEMNSVNNGSDPAMETNEVLVSREPINIATSPGAKKGRTRAQRPPPA